MPTLRVCIAAWTVFASIGQARAANVSAMEFVRQYELGDRSTQNYLSGLLDGFGAMNGANSNSNQRTLFCQPERLTLTKDQAINILKGYLRMYPATSEAPIWGVMLASLVMTFPCKR